MKLKALLSFAAAGVALSLAAAASISAQEGPPPPSAGEVIAGGLSATGAAIGPDGALYVPIGGEANIPVSVPEDLQDMLGAETAYFGTGGSVARVDPATGDVTTYASGLPVITTEEGEPGNGPTDAVFYGGDLFVLVTGSANIAGGVAAGYPNGIYRMDSPDTWTIVADLSAFADDNPVAFPDAFPGGNPFAIDVRGNEFIVSDGNYNRILRATVDGDISILQSFDNVVPTGLAASGPGPVLNTHFSAFPHDPADSFVISIAYPTGATTEVAGGFAQLIDVEVAGRTYVLQFGDQSLDENAPPPPGRLLILEDGELKPIVTGLMLPTSVNISGDTAYITSLTGDVLAIDGVSALQPVEEPAPEPTTPPQVSPTVPTGPITPPDTGTGDLGGGSSPLGIIAALAVAGVLFSATGALALARRR